MSKQQQYGVMAERGNPFASQDHFGASSGGPGAPARAGDHDTFAAFEPYGAPQQVQGATGPTGGLVGGLPARFLPTGTVPSAPPVHSHYSAEPVILQSVPAQRRQLSSTNASDLSRQFKKVLVILSVFSFIKLVLAGLSVTSTYGTGFVFVAVLVGLVACGFVGLTTRRVACLQIHFICGFVCSIGLGCSVILSAISAFLYFSTGSLFSAISTGLSGLVVLVLCLTVSASSTLARRLCDEFRLDERSMDLPMMPTESVHVQPGAV